MSQDFYFSVSDPVWGQLWQWGGEKHGLGETNRKTTSWSWTPILCFLSVTFCALSLLESCSSPHCHPYNSIYLAHLSTFSKNYFKHHLQALSSVRLPLNPRDMFSFSMCPKDHVYACHCNIYHIASFPPSSLKDTLYFFNK